MGLHREAGRGWGCCRAGTAKGGCRRRCRRHVGERVKHLVLGQLDLEVALRVGERVAETEIGDAINEHAEFQHHVAGGNLFVQRAGLHAGGDPRGESGRVEAKFFHTVTG